MSPRPTPPSLVVFKKELLDGVRDLRSLFSAFFFPLLGPLIVAIVAFNLQRVTNDQEQDTLHVEGAERAPALVALLGRDLDIQPAPPGAEEQVRSGELTALLRVPEDFSERTSRGEPAVVELISDGSKHKSRDVAKDVEEAVNAYAGELGALRLLARGVDPSLLRGVSVDRIDVAPPERLGGDIVGAMVGMFVIVSAFFCNLYLVIDATAAERERRSWEPLLLTAAPRRAIVLGKWMAGLTFGYAGVIATTLLTLIPLSWLDLERAGIRLLISPAAIGMILVHVLPLAAFASAAQLLLASLTRSFKEAQTYLSLTMFLPMIPGMWMSIDPIPAAPWMMAVPSLAQQLLITRTISGEATPLGWQLGAAAACLAAAALALVGMRWVVGREQ
ncbi:ABC transporter permease subunit [Myxococcota bacterium]|nr:ABC transporter permease subunit [Myxococcota bacterium]